MTRHLHASYPRVSALSMGATGSGGTSAPPVWGRLCPCGNRDHTILELSDEAARQVGLAPGRPVLADRSRQPATGDLVWVELVRHGSTQRLVRQYARDHGLVTLSAPGGGAAAILRRSAELLVLGVVDPAASCAALTA
jgi:hypothetical protein